MGVNDQLIVEAVQNGTLEEKVLDTAVERILNIVYRYAENRDTEAVFDLDHDHEVAKKVAEETIVLLKNENVLPLTEGEEIAFIGKYAKSPDIRAAAVPISTVIRSQEPWMRQRQQAIHILCMPRDLMTKKIRRMRYYWQKP